MHTALWANIVAFDMRMQRLATPYPQDRHVCCGFGPGGLRGLNSVLGRHPEAALHQRVAMLWAKYLADTIEWLPPRPEAYLVQWWLCEFSQVFASSDMGVLTSDMGARRATVPSPATLLSSGMALFLQRSLSHSLTHSLTH